ncbi:MAG: hypothetical protein AB8C95_05060, partial [Phycisphaeraceae bacterium]
MPKKHMQPIFAAILSLSLFTLPGCGDGPAAEAPPPTAVTVAKPVVKTVTQYHEYTGNTAAVNQVDIVARVPGVLVKQNYKLLGEDNRVSRVNENEILFEIEHEPYEIAVALGEADVKRSVALEAAAESVFKNVKTSFDRGAAAELDLTKADADFKQRTA